MQSQKTSTKSTTTVYFKTQHEGGQGQLYKSSENVNRTARSTPKNGHANDARRSAAKR